MPPIWTWVHILCAQQVQQTRWSQQEWHSTFQDRRLASGQEKECLLLLQYGRAGYKDFESSIAQTALSLAFGSFRGLTLAAQRRQLSQTHQQHLDHRTCHIIHSLGYTCSIGEGSKLLLHHIPQSTAMEQHQRKVPILKIHLLSNHVQIHSTDLWNWHGY